MNLLQLLLGSFIGWMTAPETPSAPLICNLSVMTNPSEITICNPGATVSLNAIISGGVPQMIQWTPTNGVANPNSANTTAVVNGSTTFQVNVTALSSDNLIFNGNFNSGAVGFTSDYIPGTGGAFGLLSLEGQYAVSTNPMFTHTNFANCDDHSPGNGNMMVVNGAGVANQEVWCQVVNVTPNTNYGFSAWIASVVASSPAQLQFSVNGGIIGGTFMASSATCNWTEFFQTWNSGPTGMAEICIVNQNTALSGNDFAIDDIYFAEICQATDIVTVTLVDLDATWFPPDDLCQSSPPFLLNSLLAPFATPGGTWTINNNPSTIFDPANLGVGAHQVRYTVTQDGCTESFTGVIVVLPLPSASWSPPINLCQTSPTFNLNTLLLPGSEPGGVWRVNGVVSTTFNPSQLGPGDHFVTYTVGTPPCVNQEVNVITVLPLPDASWTPPLGLCTSSPSFVLNTLLDPGTQTGGTWRINGTIASVFNPATLGTGTHSVSYTVGIVPCAATITQNIVVGFTPAVPQPTCEVSGQNEIVFTWPAVTGATSYEVDVVTGQMGMLSNSTFTVNNLLPGETVTIRVMANGTGGCESAWSMPVSCTTTSCVQPIVMIQEVARVCFDSMAPSFTLTAVVSDMNGTGVWSGTGIANANTGLFNPVLAGVGLHPVYYTYTVNGCSARDTAQVLVQAPAVLDFSLDTTVCIGDTAMVSFTGMASDTAVFSWNFDGATIVSGINRGPYQLIWNTSGDHTVQLIVQDGACPADTLSKIIRVEALLAPPEILCRTTLSSVEFYWSTQPDAESYSAAIISGPAGMMSSDTSFIVTGLLPGEAVEMALSVESATACPDTSAQRTCIASDCPDVILTLITPPPICLMPNTGNIQLMATIQGAMGMGVGVWHGTGILDTLLGTFRPALALEGENLITFTYTEGNCTYSADASIFVNHRPSPFFEADSVICQNSTATLTYTGDAPATATFTWGLDGGTIESGSGIGPLVVSWPTPGIKNVRLVVENGGCTSVPFFQDVQVDAEVEVPLIQCISTINSVEFYWNDVANSAAYVINLIQGPVGTITSDTSYRMMNLLPEQEVVIQMTTFSSNACPGSVQLSNCQTLPCPAVQLDAPPVFTCYEGMPDTLQLQATAMGSTGMGTISWSGEGIINSQQNLFVTHAGMVGRTIPVAILYREGACDYRDTLLVQVNPVPTPDFTLGAEPCENGETTITYTGTASAQAVFQWNFGTDATVTGSGAGPYQVSWPDAGMKDISLQIEDSGCTSAPLQQSIEVLAPLPLPVITCEATYTEITFSWAPVPGMTGFEINVIDGMPGMLVNDTTYIIQNLQPGDAATIEVEISDNGPCPPVSSELTCETLLCPAVQLVVDEVAPICFDGMTDTLTLTFSLSGDSPQGSLQWSGAGIFDTNMPSVILTSAMIGQPNIVRATYTESVCVYSDSISIDLRAVPLAAFTADPLICNSDASNVVFTGSATNAAVYNWNFDGGQATPGTNAGPHQVRWNDAGQYDVSLWITDAGCLSDTFSLTVQVDEPLVPPVLNCVPDYDNLTISWPSVAGASNYDLQLPTGISGTALSDTVFVIENLQPNTPVSYTLTVFGNTICGPVSVMGSCNTLICPERSLTWSAPAAICRGDVASIQLDLHGNTGNPWQITFSDGSTTYNFNIANDTTIQLSPMATSTFSVSVVSDPSLTICGITLPTVITTIVNMPVEAGTALAPLEFCTGENGTVALATLLQGADAGGVWTETSTVPSTAGAFNATAGTFNIASQAAATYRFRYQMNAIAPCLSDFAEVTVIINPTPRADAGADQSLDCLTEIAPLGGPLTTIRPGLIYQWQSSNGAVVEQPAQPTTQTMQAGSFTLVVTDPVTGCRSQDVMQVIDRVNELDLFAHAIPATCLNDRGAIFVDSVTGGALPYAFSLNGAPFVLQQAFASLEPGAYTLVAQDATGCVTEVDLQIEAATTLDVELIANLIDEPYTITLGDSTELTALVNIPFDQVQDVRWQPADSVRCVGCLEQTVQPFFTTTYVVTVRDVNGCMASDDLTIFVRRERDIFIPNVFSPNGDGLNDVFMIFGGRQVRKVNSFLIFTRWGESIFENYNFQPNDPAHGWNGFFRNLKANSGVYVYFAEVEFIDGEVLIYKGDVTLLN